jgi:ribonuclease HI
MNIGRLVINVDGLSKGNPGPSAIGVVIRDAQGRLVDSISNRIGMATNNQAEYRALIAALERAIELNAKEIHLESDSELLVRQINGRYRVKNPTLRSLYQKVLQLRNKLDCLTIVHIPRQQNAEADKLANWAVRG